MPEELNCRTGRGGSKRLHQEEHQKDLKGMQTWEDQLKMMECQKKDDREKKDCQVNEIIKEFERIKDQIADRYVHKNQDRGKEKYCRVAWYRRQPGCRWNYGIGGNADEGGQF